MIFDSIAEILDISNHEIRYDDWVPGDIKIFDIDNSRIRNDLEIDFTTDFGHGLEITVDWGKEFFNKG